MPMTSEAGKRSAMSDAQIPVPVPRSRMRLGPEGGRGAR